MVREERGPVGPQAAGCLLGGAEAVGPQENVLQLSLRVGDDAGVIPEGADCVHE